MFFVDYMAYEDIGLFIYIYVVVYVLKTFALTDELTDSKWLKA